MTACPTCLFNLPFRVRFCPQCGARDPLPAEALQSPPQDDDAHATAVVHPESPVAAIPADAPDKPKRPAATRKAQSAKPAKKTPDPSIAAAVPAGSAAVASTPAPLPPAPARRPATAAPLPTAASSSDAGAPPAGRTPSRSMRLGWVAGLLAMAAAGAVWLFTGTGSAGRVENSRAPASAPGTENSQKVPLPAPASDCSEKDQSAGLCRKST